MDMRRLRYYVTVAEEQSFTKAAEKLFIAQPPLSRQIQNLETDLGIQLFERGSRPLKMTTAGEFLYQHAVKLLSNAAEIKAMTQRIGGLEHTITMGFVGSVLYGLLSKIVYLYSQQQPHLKIEMVEMTTMQQIIALKDGRIDVGFGRLHISDPAIKRVLLRDEALFLALHSSHHLAANKEGIYLADIVNENIFLYPNQVQPSFATLVQNLFSEYNLDPANLRTVRELQLALGFVAAGIGVCIVPESARSIQLAHLHYLPILDATAVSPIFMSVRNMDKSKDLVALLDCIYQIYDLEGFKYDRCFLH